MNKFRRRYGLLLTITICSLWGICLLATDDPASPVVEKTAAVTPPVAAEVDPIAPAIESKLGLPAATDEKPAVIKPNWKGSLQGFDLILVETDDGLAGYSKSLDHWDRVVVGLCDDGKLRLSAMTVGKSLGAGAIGNELLAFGSESGSWDRISFPEQFRGTVKPTIGTSFAAVVVGDELFGFSSQAGRWGKLAIPQVLRGKVVPIVGLNMLYADMGNRIVVLSPKTGEWTSSDELNVPKAGQGIKPESSTIIPVPIPHAATVSPKEQELKTQISQREWQAVNAAKKIHALSKAYGKDHPSVIDAKRELNERVAAALDLKFQHERMQVELLQKRLNQLQSHIDQRQARRSNIIERRAQELTEGDILKWEQPDESGQTEWNNRRSPGPTTSESANKPPRFNASSQYFSTLDRGRQDLTVKAAEVSPPTKAVEQDPLAQPSVDEPVEIASRNEIASRKSELRSQPLARVKEDDVASNLPFHDFAAKIVDAHQNLAAAKAEFDVVNELSKSGTATRLEFVKAQSQLERATRAWKFMHDEYSAILQDLQLQMKAAAADASYADRTAERCKQLRLSGAISEKVADEAEQRVRQTKFAVDRLQIQVDLLEKAAEDLVLEKNAEPDKPSKDLQRR